MATQHLTFIPHQLRTNVEGDERGWIDVPQGADDEGHDGLASISNLLTVTKTAALYNAAPDLLHELGGIADALAAGEVVRIEPGSIKAVAVAAAIAKAEGR